MYVCMFKICISIDHMVLNPSTPEESPFDEQNRLALDRVKSITSLLGVKGLYKFKTKNCLREECKKEF